MLCSWKQPLEGGYTVVIKRWTWAETAKVVVAFKHYPTGSKSAKKNINHTIAPLLPASDSDISLVVGQFKQYFFTLTEHFLLQVSEMLRPACLVWAQHFSSTF